jgi:hypothetical protein
LKIETCRPDIREATGRTFDLQPLYFFDFGRNAQVLIQQVPKEGKGRGLGRSKADAIAGQQTFESLPERSPQLAGVGSKDVSAARGKEFSLAYVSSMYAY